MQKPIAIRIEGGRVTRTNGRLRQPLIVHYADSQEVAVYNWDDNEPAEAVGRLTREGFKGESEAGGSTGSN